jgi:hypothetical protein
VCGSVAGLLMIAETWTYLPPTCWSTLAYSFSTPIAVMAAALVVPALLVPLPDAEDEDEDEHALASRAAASGRAMAITPERVRMTL